MTHPHTAQTLPTSLTGAGGLSECRTPVTSVDFTAGDAEKAAGAFKALGDPVRLMLLSRIASHPAGEACVCDIADVGVSQPTVSHHLKKLREVGLLTSDRRGTWVYYRVEPGALDRLALLLGELS